MADLTPQMRAPAKPRRRAESLVGFRFGEYVVTELESPRAYGKDGRYIRRYVCHCSCGVRRVIAASTIKGRPPYSCVTCRRSKGLKPTEAFRSARKEFSKTNFAQLAHVDVSPGMRVGRFTVTKQVQTKGSLKWLCRCDCGNLREKTPTELRNDAIGDCSDCARARRAMSIEYSALQHITNNYTQRAKKRKLLFELSKDDVIALITQECSYCGQMRSNTYKKPGTEDTYRYNGIDRVDPTKGYTSCNVVPCCSNCNVAKLDRSKDEFIAHVRQIVEHLNLEIPRS